MTRPVNLFASGDRGREFPGFGSVAFDTQCGQRSGIVVADVFDHLFPDQAAKIEAL